MVLPVIAGAVPVPSEAQRTGKAAEWFVELLTALLELDGQGEGNPGAETVAPAGEQSLRATSKAEESRQKANALLAEWLGNAILLGWPAQAIRQSEIVVSEPVPVAPVGQEAHGSEASPAVPAPVGGMPGSGMAVPLLDPRKLDSTSAVGNGEGSGAFGVSQLPSSGRSERIQPVDSSSWSGVRAKTTAESLHLSPSPRRGAMVFAESEATISVEKETIESVEVSAAIGQPDRPAQPSVRAGVFRSSPKMTEVGNGTRASVEAYKSQTGSLTASPTARGEFGDCTIELPAAVVGRSGEANDHELLRVSGSPQRVESEGRVVQGGFAPTSSGSTAPPVADTVPASRDDPMTQVSEQIRSGITTGKQYLRVRLHPPELGVVDVQLREVGGRLDVRLAASQPEVHTLLDQAREGLRQVLIGSGFDVRHVEVQPLGNSSGQGALSGQASGGFAGQGSQSQRQAWGEAAPRWNLPWREAPAGAGGGRRETSDRLIDTWV